MPNRLLEFSWQSDKGRVRALNEDAVAVLPELRLAVVADGIGGANAGEVASRIAVEVITERFRARDALPVAREQAMEVAREAVSEANRVICETARETPRYVGMGTTVVVGFAGPDWMVFAHVGDSRLYLLRGNELRLLTRDHSLIQEVVDQGFFPTLEDARRYGVNENILTRGLGTTSEVSVDAGDVDMMPGDLFLFCTDGLTGMVTDDDVRNALADDGGDLEDLGRELVKLASDGGGLDNITLALMRVG